uniref:DDE_Tnp_1_7 domain-containing protein n=1 Tax=Strongyloides papillosus TaxID=174720 RepID=A0A0N5BD23_STREA
MLENGEFSDIDDMEENEDEVDSRECEILKENNNINKNVRIQDTEPLTEGFQSKKIVRWRKQTPDTLNFEWIENVKLYITDEIFEQMAEYTNIYAHQREQTQFKPTNIDEIKTLFGLHIIIGCLNKFPQSMSKNMFFQLRTMLHLVNNLERPSSCTNRFYKVRPIMDVVLKRCKELKIGQDISIDEQIIPFTGKINMLHTTEKKDNVKIYGQSSAIVLELVEIVKKEGHRVYFDNYFNSSAFLLRLLELKIYAAGTVPLETTDKAKWWDKQKSAYIEIDRPEVVRKYNKSIGGVDLLDMYISLYRINTRSRK